MLAEISISYLYLLEDVAELMLLLICLFVRICFMLLLIRLFVHLCMVVFVVLGLVKYAFCN